MPEVLCERMERLDKELQVLLRGETLTEFQAVRAANLKQQVRSIYERFYRQQIEPVFTATSSDIARQSLETEAELMETVFPHPTLSEMMHESVLDAYDRVLHM